MAYQDANSDLKQLNPPQEHLQASVDDKGRLNTPAAAVAYFKSHGIEDFFCTTLDDRMALIYPLTLWLAKLENMATSPETAAIAKRLAFQGQGKGGVVKLDKNGRLLLPSNLRSRIDVEKQAVWLAFHNGFAKLMNKAVYDAEMQSSEAHRADDLKVWESLGMS